MESKSETYINICKIALIEAIENYILNISISEYCENYPIEELLSENEISIHNTVKNWIYEDINREIFFNLDKLNNENLKTINIPKIDIDTSEIYNIIDSYSEPKIKKKDNYVTQIVKDDNYEFDIENIFER